MNMSAHTQELVMEILTRYGLQVLGALAIVVIGLLIARWLGGLVDQRFQKTQMEPPMRILLVRVIKIIVLILAVVVALDKFGFSVAPLVAGIGVAGLGFGLALQGVLGNIVAGLTIIFTKPFRVGEHIAIVGVRGDVTHIELSATTLVQADLSRVIVPNRKIVGEILHNFGTMRQLTLSVRVPHPTDLNLALQAARQVVMESARTLKEPVPSVGIAAVDDIGIKIEVQPWVRVVDVVTAEPELYQALVEAFRARGIGVPVAAHDVRLLNGQAGAVR
jgi:small conductance mechanosensitive channel